VSRVLLENHVFMARYNSWFNQRLYAACGKLDDAQRKLDRGAFFGSIHRTLNHLVVADQIWLKRFRQFGEEHGLATTPLTNSVLDLPLDSTLATVLFHDWPQLVAKREQLDAAIEQWLGDLSSTSLQFTMRYGNTKGLQRAHPMWQALSHFFNHQTHHRGQVTAMLNQAGVDVGVTDMIALV
jgi:uncharacterized damage-inducible protein DinB